MATTLACSCGKTVRASDSLAGKRVRCPACAAVLLVPGGAPDPFAGPPPLPEDEVPKEDGAGVFPRLDLDPEDDIDPFAAPMPASPNPAHSHAATAIAPPLPPGRQVLTAPRAVDPNAPPGQPWYCICLIMISAFACLGSFVICLTSWGSVFEGRTEVAGAVMLTGAFLGAVFWLGLVLVLVEIAHSLRLLLWKSTRP